MKNLAIMAGFKMINDSGLLFLGHPVFAVVIL